MHVTKIDIQKEEMEIPDYQPVVEFAEFKSEFGTKLLDPDELPVLAPESSIKRYEVMRVITIDGQKKKLLVEVDDRNLFQELLEITNEKLDQYVASKLEEHTYWTKKETEESTKRSIRSLPFWERLFNKF